MKTSAIASRPPLALFASVGSPPVLALAVGNPADAWKSGQNPPVTGPRPGPDQTGSNRFKPDKAISGGVSQVLANPPRPFWPNDGCADPCAAIRRRYRYPRRPRRGQPSLGPAVESNRFAPVRAGSHRLEPKVPPRPASAGHRDCNSRNGSHAAIKCETHWRRVVSSFHGRLRRSSPFPLGL